MIVRQTTTTILFLQLILLLLSHNVASISLSQFQQIQGFSDSCENVWQEDIPGCIRHDFTVSNDCSRNCLAGVNIINAEVLVACAEARVNSNTLLGQFLAGFGVSALCGNSVTMAGSTTATATAMKTTTTTTSTSATSVRTTTSAATSTSSSATTSSTATSITDPNLTLSFSSTTTASPTSSIASTTTSAKTSSTSSSNTEAKGFGGVGDAFDILGGKSAGCRLEYMSWKVMCLMSVVVIALAREI
ncbi:hypothetical protein TMatcc_002015 [Talaromyces marneffei ATCC 18224]|uniref:Receptor-type tyrosine-protein phosphatase C n=1 Tax=Talaromyces marneffei PM1 TaxID=1077442 RepID=A0A093V471_TALMA|nr:uncharacterized protein EYB26_006803 [Talaromyces marneffei]KAE8552011.1 hypothetical protein EYB25_005902 [Talaromyces marneffei]QGA19115.1 hypothetical protein EYB26_006803 [Talaromyces marneffei]